MSESPTDKELKEFGRGLLLGVVFGTLLGGILGVALEESASEEPSDVLRQEAVERGYAEWRLTHAHNGATEFFWVEPKATSRSKPSSEEVKLEP